ncbi:MAG: helix-hairpin-helix domain-containing protein [Promethearchaeota archaeon]
MINITSIMQIANSIGKGTAEKMKQIGIDSIEKLASASVESLLVIDEIGIKSAKSYIQFAQKHIERIKARKKIYNMINKRDSSNGSKSQDFLSDREPFDNKNIPKVPIKSIKKLASSSIEDLSKLEHIGIPNAKKYVEIAKKYLEGMRIKEENEAKIKKELVPSVSRANNSSSQNQLIGFIDLSGKSEPKKMKTEILPPKKKSEMPPLKIKSIPLKKPQVNLKSIKKPEQRKIIEPTPIKSEIGKQPQLKTFFSPEIIQKIRFLHHKIKKLEEALERNEIFSFSELNNIIEYIKILNVNYKTQSQIKIFKELEITPSFNDPIARKEIKIWDLIFECSRVLWIAAQAYSYLSTKFEEENSIENAIVAMVECSKMYKTAAYFSAACTRQEDKGIALSVENLEMNSEESRILAQNLATISEEKKENFSMAANLSAGLSALTKRLAFLRRYNDKKEFHFKAQYNYDIGRACHLKAKSLSRSSSNGENEEKCEKLQKKANYYYLKAEEIWESMLKSYKELSETEKKGIRTNLSIVNENIIENDVETINDREALDIPDPEPLIIIPENLAPFIPRTTNFLTQYKQVDLNFNAYLRYKNLMSEVMINPNKIQELQNSKAGIGRTLKQLQILYENNDIDINSFSELYEKYSIKLESIEAAIRNLRDPQSKTKIPKEQKEILKSIM